MKFGEINSDEFVDLLTQSTALYNNQKIVYENAKDEPELTWQMIREFFTIASTPSSATSPTSLVLYFSKYNLTKWFQKGSGMDKHKLKKVKGVINSLERKETINIDEFHQV